MFAAFPLDLSLVPNPQMFMLPIQQPKLVQALAERAVQYQADIRWGTGLPASTRTPTASPCTSAGPMVTYELRAKYLVGADGGTSPTRKLAGIDFPGMTSHDAVARMGFDVLPPAEWVDPVSGALDVPGFGRIPPLGFHRAERGVFRLRRPGAPGGGDRLRAGPTAREHPATITSTSRP